MKLISNHDLHFRIFVAACIVLMMTAYVGSYILLRNRSLSEVSLIGVEGILYVSVDHLSKTKDPGMHTILSYIFAPLNFIDQKLFGGPGPARCMLFDLS